MQARESVSSIITLTTDFGLEDAYVGSMKGTILSINPGILLIDITHHLPAHQILRAAWLLRETGPRFPAETIHVAVVDPGVGGHRRPVLLRIADRFYVGPDNGVFGLLLEDFALQGAWKLENREYFLPSVSRTFHGRDVFAPVAAHLACGVPPDAFGPSITDPSRITIPLPHEETGQLTGQVVWVDRFGNCITNLTEKAVARWAEGDAFIVLAASKMMTRISASYESIPNGEALILFNSMGLLEIACNKARADRVLGLNEGNPVVLKRVSSHESLEGKP